MANTMSPNTILWTPTPTYVGHPDGDAMVTNRPSTVCTILYVNGAAIRKNTKAEYNEYLAFSNSAGWRDAGIIIYFIQKKFAAQLIFAIQPTRVILK
jgi:hypothetical protein